MAVATFRGEKSIADIADKLFVKLTPKQRKSAEAALLKANPQLRDIDSLRQGSILRVPDLPELRPKAVRSLENPDDQIADDLSVALAEFSRLAGGQFKAEIADTRSGQALLGSAALKKALAGAPELQELADEAGRALDARSKALAGRAGELDKAVALASKQLARQVR